MKRIDSSRLANLTITSCEKIPGGIFSALPERLTILHICDCSLANDAVMDNFCSYLKTAQTLTDLNITRCGKVVGETVDFFNSLPISLQKISLVECEMLQKSVYAFSNWLKKKPNVLALVFDDKAIDMVPAFADALAASYVQSLRLGRMTYSQEFTERFIAFCAEGRKFKKVVLNGNGINDESQKKALGKIPFVQINY